MSQKWKGYWNLENSGDEKDLKRVEKILDEIRLIADKKLDANKNIRDKILEDIDRLWKDVTDDFNTVQHMEFR